MRQPRTRPASTWPASIWPASQWFVAAPAALVVACGNPLIPADATPAYATAYEDGCDSGYTEAFRDGFSLKFRKDTAAFEASSEYRRGWEDGYAYCYEDEWRAPLMLPSGGRWH